MLPTIYKLKSNILYLAAIIFLALLSFGLASKYTAASAQTFVPASPQLRRVTLEKLVNGSHNKLFMAYVRDDGTPMTRWYDANTGAWTDWKYGSGTIRKAFGNVSMMDYNGKLYQAIRENGSDVIYTRSFDGNNWTEWVGSGGSTLSKQIAMENYGGRLFQAVRGMDDMVYIRSTSDGTNWTNWNPMYRHTVGEISLEGFPGAKIFLSVRDKTDEEVYISNSIDGLNWSGWDSPQAATTQHNVETRIFNGRVYQSISYKDPGGSNDRTWYTRSTDPNNVLWSSWTLVNSGDKARGDIFLEASGSHGALYQAAVGLDNYIYTRTYTPGGGWSGFDALTVPLQTSWDLDMEEFNGQMYQSLVGPGSSDLKIRSTYGLNAWNGLNGMPSLTTDIQPIAINYTGTVGLNQELTFSPIIRNNGGTESRNFNVRWSVPGTVVSEVDPHGNVPGNSQVSSGATFRYTPTQTGIHTIQLETDVNWSVDETNESNNTITIQINVPGGAADLAPQTITFDKPLPLVEGDVVKLSSKVVNQGNLAANNISVKWYIDNQLVSTQSIASLAANDLNGVTKDITWTAVKGIHNIVIGVDPDNTISESNESNNTQLISFNVQGRPDLQAQAITYDAARTRLGNTIELKSGVINPADVGASSFSARWYVKGPNDANYNLFQARTHNSIPANTTTPPADNASIFQWTPTTDGVYYIKFVVDENNAINESNENNNQTIKAVFIIVQANSCEIVGLNGGSGVKSNGVINVDFGNEFIKKTATDTVRINFVLGPWTAVDDPGQLHDGKTWEQVYNEIIDNFQDRGITVYAAVGAEAVHVTIDGVTYHGEDGTLLEKDYFDPTTRSKAEQWVTAYASTYEKIVNMFGDRVKLFESINEPNPDRPDGGRVHPSWYTMMLHDIDHRRDLQLGQGNTKWQGLKLISGPMETQDFGCTPPAIPGDNCGLLAGNYMKQAYDFGVYRYGWTEFPVDGFGLHIYVATGNTDAQLIRNSNTRILDDFWGKITSTGEGSATTKRIWVSEFGWNGRSFTDFSSPNNHPDPATDQDNPAYAHMADNMTVSFNQFKNDARIAMALYYSLADYNDPNRQPAEQWFGLYLTDDPTHQSMPKLKPMKAFLDQVCNPSRISITANFSGPSYARSGYSLKFADTSTLVWPTVTKWEWDFGDGSPKSNLPNPSHTYTVPGTYQIKLTVSDGIHTNTVTKSIRIVWGTPIPDDPDPCPCSGPDCGTTTMGDCPNSQ